MNRDAAIQVEKVIEELAPQRRFPPYSEYRDSGVKWLDSIPSHWETRRLKNVLACKITDGPHTTPTFLSDGVPFLSVDGIQNGELVFDGCRYVSESDHHEYIRKAFPRQGDILLGKAASTGKIARVKVDFEFSIWSPLALIRVSEKHAFSPFVEYALKSPGVQAQIDVLCTSNTQKNISMDDIPLLAFALPGLNEQREIAAFLDRETARIDELITKKQRLIELLAEKRTALISHAVTKGLNPDAPMKDSGIEWFGDIPDHWKITRLGWVSVEVSDINHEMPTSAASGVAFLSAKDLLDDGTLNFSHAIKRISDDDFERLSRKSRPRRGDIIYSRIGACLGKARLVEVDERFLVSYSCCLVRMNPSVADRKFFRHLLDAEMVLTEAKMRTQGIGVPDLGLSEICRFPVPLPPKSEQHEIADYLDEKDATLRLLSRRINDGLDQLREYRSALISAAVTGKIDVSGEESR